MKSAQFFHLETYKQKSEKKSLKNNSDTRETHFRGVLNEARRTPGFCDHVAEPEAPLVLYGVNIDEVESLTENYIKNFRMKNEKGIERKIRKDSAVLLAGVVSLDREEIKIWDDYKKDAINFLVEKYGDRLKSVIEHTDEAHPHIHFYLVANSDELVNDLHDGKRATAEMLKFNRKNKNNKQSQQAEYRKAMTKLQDSFYFSVAKKYGLDRTGEKPRTRLSRGDYKKQEKERLAAGVLLDSLKIEALETEETIKKEIAKFENNIKKEKETIKSESEKLYRVTKKTAVSEGFNSAIEDFKKLNYWQKMIFTLDFQRKKIVELETKNQDLTKNYKIVLRRKNYYKNEVEKKEDFEEKYIKLKRDFGKRLNNALGEVKVQNDELRIENQKLKSENENLKNEILLSKYATEFLAKLKKKLGSEFEKLRKEFFPEKPTKTTPSDKLKI